YSGMKFAYFFLAEYTNMIVVSALVTVAFFGVWLRPFPNVRALDWLENGWLLDQRVGGGTRLLFVGGILGGFLGFGIGAADLFGVASASVPQLSGAFWFGLKVSFFLFAYIWFRGTYPRYRYDQLMDLGWKWLLLMSIANVLLTGLVLLLRGGGAS